MHERQILIELSDNYYELHTESELEEMESQAMEFDGFTGWRVVGYADELEPKKEKEK